MDNNKSKLLLLRIIKFNGNIEPLEKMGFEYVQISEMIKNEITLRNAAIINGELKVTEQGNMLINELNAKYSNQNSEKWIEPEYHSKVEKLKKNDIYLPNPNELWFLK